MDKFFCIMLDGETDVFDRLYPTLQAAIAAHGCFVPHQDYKRELRILPCRMNPTTGQWQVIGRAWVYTLSAAR